MAEQANRGQRAAWSKLAAEVAQKTKDGELKNETEQQAYWSERVDEISRQKSKAIGNALNGKSWVDGKFNAEASAKAWGELSEGIGR